MYNMHTDSITVDLDAVRTIIDELGDVFTTIDVLKKYQGGFYSNKNINVNISFNAQFGKILSRNAEYLGIEKTENGEKSQNDDLGNPTKTQEWRKVR